MSVSRQLWPVSADLRQMKHRSIGLLRRTIVAVAATVQIVTADQFDAYLGNLISQVFMLVIVLLEVSGRWPWSWHGRGVVEGLDEAGVQDVR